MYDTVIKGDQFGEAVLSAWKERGIRSECGNPRSIHKASEVGLILHWNCIQIQAFSVEYQVETIHDDGYGNQMKHVEVITDSYCHCDWMTMVHSHDPAESLVRPANSYLLGRRPLPCFSRVSRQHGLEGIAD